MNEIIKNYQTNKKNKEYTQIFNEYYPSFKNYLKKYTQNQFTVEDVAIESFQKAMNKIDSFDTTKNFKTWLYTIGKNDMIQTLNKNKVFEHTDFNSDPTDETRQKHNNIAKNILAQNDLHDFELKNKQKFISDYDLLIEEINNLRPELKDVLIDSYLNNLTFDKIMIKHNLTESQVKLKLMTGKIEIREKFYLSNLKKLEKEINQKIELNRVFADLIKLKLKYNGNLVKTKKGKGYSFQYHIKNELKVNNAIQAYVKTFNKKSEKTNTNAILYNELQVNLNEAKKAFEEKINSLEKEGYKLTDKNLKVAENNNYIVSTEGYTTRNNNFEKLIKVEKINNKKLIKPIMLLNKNNNTKNIKISFTETKNYYKLTLK